MTSLDPRMGADVDESRDFRAQFAYTSRRLHNRAYFRLIFGVVGVVLIAPAWFWHPPRIYILAVVMPLCLFGAGLTLWTFVWSSKVKCPSCQKRLEVLKRYCPSCGTDGLHKVNAIPQTRPTLRCDQCQKDYYPFTGVNRKYLIRYCTHCDVFLDNDGV
jgi:hypothetical protein